MRVDVVITNYNDATYVADAVRSVLAQTHRDMSITVVDDGSSDESLEVLSQFSERVRILSLPLNRGLPTARNTGIVAGTSPLVALLDSDDVWLPEKLERQVREFENHPRLGLCYSGSVDSDARFRPLGTRRPPRVSNADVFDALYLDAFPMPPSTVMLRREALAEAGLFDVRMRKAQDIECWLRVAMTSTVSCLPEPLVLRRRHPSSISAVAGPAAVMHHDRLVFELCGEAASRVGRVLPMPVSQRVALGLSRRSIEALQTGSYTDAFAFLAAWWGHPDRTRRQGARIGLAAVRGLPHLAHRYARLLLTRPRRTAR